MCIAIANCSRASLGHTWPPCGQKQRDRHRHEVRGTRPLVKTRCTTTTGDAGLPCACQPAKRKHLRNSTWQGYSLALLEFYSQWLLLRAHQDSGGRPCLVPTSYGVGEHWPEEASSGQCLTGQDRLGIDGIADGSHGKPAASLVCQFVMSR